MLVPVVAQFPSNVGTVLKQTVLEAGLVCKPLLFPKLTIRNCSSVTMRVTLELVLDQGINANVLFSGTYTNTLTQVDLPANGLLVRDLGPSLGSAPTLHKLSVQALAAPGGKVLTLVEGLYESLGLPVPVQLPVVF